MALPDLESMTLEEHEAWRVERRAEMRAIGEELRESKPILERQIAQRRKDDKRAAYGQRVTPTPAVLRRGDD